MKVIVAGSRGIEDINIVAGAMVLCKFPITEIVSGTSRGVDQLGEQWAQGQNIPIKRFPANWKEFGKGAGFKRNAEMAEYADMLVAVWDGKSRGTKHMIDTMEKMGKPVEVLRVMC